MGLLFKDIYIYSCKLDIKVFHWLRYKYYYYETLWYPDNRASNIAGFQQQQHITTARQAKLSTSKG